MAHRRPPGPFTPTGLRLVVACSASSFPSPPCRPPPPLRAFLCTRTVIISLVQARFSFPEETLFRFSVPLLRSSVPAALLFRFVLRSELSEMVGWQRHLQSLVGHLRSRTLGTSTRLDAYRSFTYSSSSDSVSVLSRATVTRFDQLGSWQRLWRLSPSSSSSFLPGSSCQYQHFNWISTSRKLLADSSESTPVSSPLTPALITSSGTTEGQKAVSKLSKVQAVLKGIKQSPKKVNLVATLVRGMRVEDALLQLQVTVKRAAKTVYQVIHSARANATHNHGLDADRLLVAEAFVGKGLYKKRANFHGKGRCGLKVRPVCRLTVVVREITPEEEAEIARLRVHNFKKLTKRERRLVPHTLIETTPIWNRKRKPRNWFDPTMNIHP
ncbi:hypothetical protein SAY86_026629 [Trapa natans]|uniref:Large ribosomal subunit protein uL22c n=1 Tax=Trapa natans TaxID=22666 RepID=A0AAN7KI65_TRANT|nr:hypothetical protein SAY86_026629 [Trapa natans]